MECVTVSTEFLYKERGNSSKLKNNYRIDLWLEVKRHWFVFGVLLSVLLAVLAPRVGASGGPLHTEYLSYIPLSYIYYNVGKYASLSLNGDNKLFMLATLHAHIVAPVLCAVVVTLFRDLDYRLVKGALYSSVGTGCAWLSLSLCRCETTAAVAAVNYAVSLVTTPLSMLFLCDRITIPPIGGIVSTVLTAAAPFTLGTLRQQASKQSDKQTKLSALLLVYADCCGRLCDAEGTLYVGDVLVTLVFVITWLCANACVCWWYARCGLLSTDHCHILAICCLPKSMDTGWVSSTQCTPSGLSQLPLVFLAPAQALLLSVITCPDEYDLDLETSELEGEGLPR